MCQQLQCLNNDSNITLSRPIQITLFCCEVFTFPLALSVLCCQVVTSYLAADDVVRGDADLAAVHELAPGQPLDGVLQVAGVVHEAGGLAAQLQRARSQVLVGGLSEI